MAGNETRPVWSPDGKEIAYAAIERATELFETRSPVDWHRGFQRRLF
jgi:Tol biopolymer transport system component